MARTISDAEIQQLLSEPKPLPQKWETRFTQISKTQEPLIQRNITIRSISGHQFILHARNNRKSLLDFSIILVFKDTDGTEYRIRRHNGLHLSIHTNVFEKRRNLPNAEIPICMHRHFATERYQKEGLAIDGYAEQTNDYSDFSTALDKMISETGFVLPINHQPMLPFGDK